MMKSRSFATVIVVLSVALFSFARPVLADDAETLTRMLHDFLAGVTEADVHDRFWADDLIYTSSTGTRTNKAEIMQGFITRDETDAAAPGPVFSAEDIQVQVYGDTAIVAFKLVGTPPDSADDLQLQNYFNTGTFLKRDGKWQVVAWQATIIPSPS